MIFFLAILAVTIGILALLHLRVHFWASSNKKANYDFRDKTYWVMLISFSIVLSAFITEIYGMVKWERTILSWIGIVMVVFAAVWTVWARRILGNNYSPTAQNTDPNQVLVTKGPYRFVKHPIYFGNFLTVVGLYFAFNLTYSWPAILFFFLAIIWRINEENKFLAEKFN